MNRLIDRRVAIRNLSAIAACTTVPSLQSYAEQSVKRTGMGLVIYDCSIRRKWMRQKTPEFDLFEPLTFLKHCHVLGAGGMQANLGVLRPNEVETLREFAGQHELFIDAIVKPPKDERDLDRFEAEIQTACDVGVQAARTTIIPGRRYERFKSLDEFREFEKRGHKMLEHAAPIVEKHRVRFAVENHKDQRLDERLALFQQIDSEFIGACLDTGNSFALLDGAYEPIETLAPYVFSVHLKDQALQAYDDGFRLGDIPLGKGSFDLKRMVAMIRKANPNVKIALELITRDPLKVPCLTRAFYSTMPKVRAFDLARTLEFVRQHSAEQLQEVSTLSLDRQVQLEDVNVAESIRYAREELQL